MHCVKQFVSISFGDSPQHHYNIIFQECLCILVARCASCNAWHTSSAHLCNPAGGYIRWRIDSHHWYWFATRHLQRWESSHIWYKLFYKGYHLSFLIGIWEYILHFICFYTYLFHRQTSVKKYRIQVSKYTTDFYFDSCAYLLPFMISLFHAYSL